MQFGGNDQWSNILFGADLTRRELDKQVYGMTFALLTTSEGKKMGKTQQGALWLNPDKTSPYDFYQYWRNTEDADVNKCLRMLTFLPMEEVNRLSLKNEINTAKEIRPTRLPSYPRPRKRRRPRSGPPLSATAAGMENVPPPFRPAVSKEKAWAGGALKECSLVQQRRRLPTLNRRSDHRRRKSSGPEAHDHDGSLPGRSNTPQEGQEDFSPGEDIKISKRRGPPPFSMDCFHWPASAPGDVFPFLYISSAMVKITA